MSKWRAKALELLPEFKVAIETAETPYLLWFDLLAELQRAYEQPRNESLMRRIYTYADWCWRQRPQKEADLCNCVAVSFYEHLVDHAETRLDLPRWISDERFQDLASLFEWRLGPDDFKALKLYHAKNWAMRRPDLAAQPSSKSRVPSKE